MPILYKFRNFNNLILLGFMKGKKILFISSEVIPYTPQTQLSSMTYKLPKLINENQGQTRIFIPKYGIINERRHQLHEVIRLSGINLIINDMDMPLIIKVASIPKERMQVYFIDSEDYFKDRNNFFDDGGKLYNDNDERAIFYAKGVIETIKKLNWAPNLVHIHGWISSLIPLYIKHYYKDDPTFNNTKTIVSIYDDRLSGKFDRNFLKKIQFDEIVEKNLELLKNPTYENLYKLSISMADGVIFSSKSSKEKFKELIKNNKPTLECSGDDNDYKVKYLKFYNSILDE
tara:strand:- start:6344 stop:7207 length:864 start_codon:yes stop_codon:yes gene_type:complete